MLGKEINNLVVVKLEEYTPFGDKLGKKLLAGGDELDEVKPIYSYISQHLAEAANEMLQTAPLHKLNYEDVTEAMTAEPNTEDRDIGSIEKPTDFLRLHTLQMRGWTRPVHQVIHNYDAEYALQFNRWTRGTCEKPVVVETNNRLLYFSVRRNAHEINSFYYIPRFSGNAEYDREVAELIAMHCARKVCEIFGMVEQITTFTSEINSVLENIRL